MRKVTDYVNAPTTTRNTNKGRMIYLNTNQELWTVRQEDLKEIKLIGIQNSLPQEYEEEEKLFETLNSRKNEIKNRLGDANIYMVIHDEGTKMTVAVAVEQINEVPEGMVSLNIPSQEYMVFNFELKDICKFWQYFCYAENRDKYSLNTIKPRFEIFKDSLQPKGYTEIYYPKN